MFDSRAGHSGATRGGADSAGAPSGAAGAPRYGFAWLPGGRRDQRRSRRRRPRAAVSLPAPSRSRSHPAVGDTGRPDLGEGQASMGRWHRRSDVHPARARPSSRSPGPAAACSPRANPWRARWPLRPTPYPSELQHTAVGPVTCDSGSAGPYSEGHRTPQRCPRRAESASANCSRPSLRKSAARGTERRALDSPIRSVSGH